MPFSNPITLGRPLTPAELADNFDLSQTLHDEAEAARDQAVSAAGIFASTTAGISATTNGQYFCTPSVDSAEYLVLYLNNAGTAVEVSTYPSKAAVEAAIAASAYTSLTEITANAGTDVLPVNDGAAKKTTLTKILTWIRTQANTWSAKQTFSGFIVPGESAPSIKMKKLTGTTAGAEGGSVSINHGLAGAKIIGIAVLVEYLTDRHVTPGFTSIAGYQFDVLQPPTTVNIYNHATNSENILSKPISVLITYEE